MVGCSTRPPAELLCIMISVNNGHCVMLYIASKLWLMMHVYTDSWRIAEFTYMGLR